MEPRSVRVWRGQEASSPTCRVECVFDASGEHLIGPGVHERVFVCRRLGEAARKDGEANQAQARNAIGRLPWPGR